MFIQLSLKHRVFSLIALCVIKGKVSKHLQSFKVLTILFLIFFAEIVNEISKFLRNTVEAGPVDVVHFGIKFYPTTS